MGVHLYSDRRWREFGEGISWDRRAWHVRPFLFPYFHNLAKVQPHAQSLASYPYT